MSKILQAPKSTTGLLVRPCANGLGGSVTGSISGSPAHLGGAIQPDDVVVEVEGTPFTDPEGFHRMRGQDLIGSQVQMAQNVSR